MVLFDATMQHGAQLHPDSITHRPKQSPKADSPIPILHQNPAPTLQHKDAIPHHICLRRRPRVTMQPNTRIRVRSRGKLPPGGGYPHTVLSPVTPAAHDLTLFLINSGVLEKRKHMHVDDRIDGIPRRAAYCAWGVEALRSTNSGNASLVPCSIVCSPCSPSPYSVQCRSDSASCVWPTWRKGAICSDTPSKIECEE